MERMLPADARSAAHSEVLHRVFDRAGDDMATPLAEALLSLDFSESDAERIAELNEKANEGNLTEAEQAELEAFINIGDLLTLWQLKARRALQNRA